jgi:hypothetical protein
MPRRYYPGNTQDGASNQRTVGVIYFNPDELGGGVTIPIGVGQTITRGPYWVVGFNSFMFTCASVTNSRVGVNYVHADPEAPASLLFVRSVATLAISAAAQLITFGAFATIGPSESFIVVWLRFINLDLGGAPTVVASPRLWVTAR